MPRPDDEPALDQTDRRLLAALRDDGRISIAALADTINVSRTNAYARLHRLVETGVIEGFAARANSRKLGSACRR